MKFIRGFIAIVLAGLVSIPALAEFNVGLSYARYDIDPVRLDGGHLHLGWGINVAEGLMLIPEVRVGTGVKNDTRLGTTFELDRMYGGTFRVEYNFERGFYLFAAPSYSNYKFKASGGGFNATGSSWEFGIGAGAGYTFASNYGFEAFYENVDSSNIYGLGLRMRF